MSLASITKIPELKRRLLVTFGLMAVYRIGCHIPTPGINAEALAAFFARSQGTMLGLVDMFAGGALKRLSVFALGIMPYIFGFDHPPASDRGGSPPGEAEKGRRGRTEQITQYTRYGTVLLSVIQGFGIAMGLEAMSGPGGMAVVHMGGWPFRIMTVITLTAGTAFIMWLGEQITEHGVGNGISLIIFAGIVAGVPTAIANTFRMTTTGEMSVFFILILLAFMVGVVAAIVFLERGQRRIPVQYAKRVVGRRVYGGSTTHLPLKINTAGVIPPIFASSIIMFPATIANFAGVEWMQQVANALRPGSLIYILLYVGFIFFFCYFYTAVTFNPTDVADNMKKAGGYIPGIRPGKRTSDYIDSVLTRITFGGAIYISVVCVLPTFLIQRFNVPFYFGGTALLIVVGVAIDTVAQIESHMLTRNYEGIMKKGLIKGR